MIEQTIIDKFKKCWFENFNNFMYFRISQKIYYLNENGNKILMENNQLRG